ASGPAPAAAATERRAGSSPLERRHDPEMGTVSTRLIEAVMVMHLGSSQSRRQKRDHPSPRFNVGAHETNGLCWTSSASSTSSPGHSGPTWTSMGSARRGGIQRAEKSMSRLLVVVVATLGIVGCAGWGSISKTPVPVRACVVEGSAGGASSIAAAAYVANVMD